MQQHDPPLPPSQTLPTMDDLPSEDPGEPGVPDAFHIYQPQLLREMFAPPHYSADEVFVASDLNLYYEVRQPLWHKQPDWFAVLGIPRLYEGQDLRWSYVLWQEGIAPHVIVELLSLGSEKEDLGQMLREVSQPPSKWEVYEQILRVPYYVVYDRYAERLRAFELAGSRYRELELAERRIWLPELELGLGEWEGSYQGIERRWLRWYNRVGYWVPTPAEREQQRAERLAERLRAMGLDPDVA